MTRTTPKGVLVLLVAGVLLVVGGLAGLAWNALLAGPAGPTEFGWFAYGSPAGESVPAFYVVTRRDLWGASVLVLGLVSVAGATGFLAGRRRAAEPTPPPSG